MTYDPAPIFYLGDSHVRYFRAASNFGLLSPYEVSGLEVGGATAVGMRNPNAKTNALARFRDWIRDKAKDGIVVIHLGEVDCGFVIWYRAQKYNESIENQVSESIGAYFEFVDEPVAQGFRRIVITGATLPTITDEDQVGEVVSKRSSISVSQLDRTDLTLGYNSLLKECAVARGMPYADIAEDVIDVKTHMIFDDLRNPNPLDHHMNMNLAAAYWARHLNAAFDRYQPREPKTRTWLCTQNTYLKGYPAHSRSIPSKMKLPVSAGAHVTGQLLGTSGGFYVIQEAAVDGEVTRPWISLLHETHFRQLR